MGQILRPYTEDVSSSCEVISAKGYFRKALNMANKGVEISPSDQEKDRFLGLIK